MITIPLLLPVPFFVYLASTLGLAVGLGYGMTKLLKAFDNPGVNKLGVLGMQAAGKTSFLYFLMGKKYDEVEATSKNEYESFVYKRRDGKEIKVAAGQDIGGGELYMSEYKKISDNSDVLLYLFDINKYITDENYRRICNSRFHLIDSFKKPTWFVASHRDKCKLSDNEIKEAFLKHIEGKSYRKSLNNIEFANLLSNKEIRLLADKIFNDK